MAKKIPKIGSPRWRHKLVLTDEAGEKRKEKALFKAGVELLWMAFFSIFFVKETLLKKMGFNKICLLLSKPHVLTAQKDFKKCRKADPSHRNKYYFSVRVCVNL